MRNSCIRRNQFIHIHGLGLAKTIAPGNAQYMKLGLARLSDEIVGLFIF